MKIYIEAINDEEDQSLTILEIEGDDLLSCLQMLRDKMNALGPVYQPYWQWWGTQPFIGNQPAISMPDNSPGITWCSDEATNQ